MNKFRIIYEITIFILGLWNLLYVYFAFRHKPKTWRIIIINGILAVACFLSMYFYVKWGVI